MYSYSYINRQGLVTPRVLSYLSSMMSLGCKGSMYSSSKLPRQSFIIRMQSSRPADGVDGPILKRRTKITNCDVVVMWDAFRIG